MRRSEARAKRDEGDQRAVGDPHYIFGAYCGECGMGQFRSPSGITCKGGHGDAMTVSKDEAEQIVSDRLAKQLGGEANGAAPSAKQERVEAAGKALLQEMAKVDAAADPTRWGSANEAKEVAASPGFQEIVETLWVADPKGTYDYLEEQLRLGDRRTDRGSVFLQLDDVERNARTAHKLWQTAIVERKRWELENEVVFSSMRTEATKSLQREKDQKLRSKMITDDDVESRCAAMFPDEYRAQEVRRTKMKAMVDSMENLSDCWLRRIGTLQAMFEKQR
jgi:hypothetical protein